MLKITAAPKSAGTRITFSLPAGQVDGFVSVVGNFNDWTPGRDVLRRRSNGTMSAAVTVPGDYIAVFRYLGEGGVWFDEPDADFVDAGASVVLARGAVVPGREATAKPARTKSVATQPAVVKPAKAAPAKAAAPKAAPAKAAPAKPVAPKAAPAKAAPARAAKPATRSATSRPAASKASAAKPAKTR